MKALIMHCDLPRDNWHAKYVRDFTYKLLPEYGIDYKLIYHGELLPNNEKMDLIDMSEFCVKEGSFIQTQNGLETIERIAVGDKVLTHRGRYQKVTAIYKRVVNELLEVKAFGKVPIYVTPAHPIYVFEREKAIGPTWRRYYRNPIFMPSHELSQKDGTAMPIPSDVQDIHQIDLAQYAPSHFDITEEVITAVDKCTKVIKRSYYHLRRKIPVDKNFLIFCGLYLADGSKNNSFQIEFSSHIQERAILEWIGDYVRSLGLNPIIHKGKGNYFLLKFGSYVLNNFLKEFNKGREKCLPQWFMALPPEKQLYIFTGWFLGDGYRYEKRRLAITTTSNNLANQMYLILLRNGIAAYINRRYDYSKLPNGEFFSHFRNEIHIPLLYGPYVLDKVPPSLSGLNKCKRVNEPDKKFTIAKFDSTQKYLIGGIKSIKEINYNGLVYNLSVEEDNSYVVEQTAVHNCNPWHMEVATKYKKPIICSTEEGSLISLITYLHRNDVSFKFMLSRIKHFIARSSWTRDMLRFFGISGGDISVIPYGTDLDTFKPLNKEPEEPAFLYVGSINKQKGVHHLINSYLQIRDKTDWKLKLCVGDFNNDEALLSEIKRLAERNEKIQLIPFLSLNQLPQVYYGATCFVLPQDYGSILQFGNPMVWAISCGLPAISLDQGAARDYILNGINGFLVHKLSDLPEKMLEITSMHPGWMGRISRYIAERIFNPGEIAKRYKEVYEGII